MIINNDEELILINIYSALNELVGFLKTTDLSKLTLDDKAIFDFLLIASNGRLTDFDNLLWDNNILGK